MLRNCVVAAVSLAALAMSAAGGLAAGEEIGNPANSVAAPKEAPAVEPASQDAKAGNGPKIWEAAKSAVLAKNEDAAKSAEVAMDAAPAKPAPAPEPTLKVAIDLKTQNMTVSEHGDVTYSWPISSGTADHPTPRGSFRPQWTAKMWYSRKYDNAPMPNAVFINGGVAIHATYATRMLGRPASHGCIRLAPGNAATFYRLVHKHGLKLTRVSVYGTPKWSAPAVASRRDRGGQGWDMQASQRPDAGSYRTSSYKSTSAYDWFFGKPAKAKPPVMYYPGDRPRYNYRAQRPSRYVYQRPRRTYYVDGW